MKRFEIGRLGTWACVICLAASNACAAKSPVIDENFRYGSPSPSDSFGQSATPASTTSLPQAAAGASAIGKTEGSIRTDGSPSEAARAAPSSARAQSRELERFPANSRIVFLHHSTGEVIWKGGVPRWIQDYNDRFDTKYSIQEKAFPDGRSYPWENNPFDYWNIWVAHAGPNAYSGQDTLELLTKSFRVIVWKHCFPVSAIEPNNGAPNAASTYKSIANYQLQYQALRTKMREFPQTRFLVWTGAALRAADTNREQAARARQFFEWVKNTWDEPGDNIFLWDFFRLESNGGDTLLPVHATHDSHPNEAFAKRVAPLLARRIVDVIEGRGDQGPLTGEVQTAQN